MNDVVYTFLTSVCYLGWLENVHKATPIHKDSPTIFLTTNAADSGWGAVLNGIKLKGLWTKQQQKWHSNAKELATVYEVLKLQKSLIKGKSIVLQSDNRTTVAYLTKEGGTRSLSLLSITKRILFLCNLAGLPHNCALHSRHIQWLSGRPVQNEKSPGMASISSCNPEDLSKIGSPRDRPLCISQIRSPTLLHERRCQRLQEPIHGCLQQRVAIQVGLDIFTPVINTKSPATPGQVRRDLPASGASLEKSTLDSRSNKENDTTSPSNPKSIRRPDRPRNEMLLKLTFWKVQAGQKK
ncbi:hypothetical protein ACJJTC_018665 [Scirpophaga incertulas]